jgi:phosphoglycolate phosphatase
LRRRQGAVADEELLAEAYKYFLDYYREHKLDYTYAYEGVLEALAALKQLHDLPDGAGAGDGGADQQAGSASAGDLRGAGPGSLLSEHLRRQQFREQEARSGGVAGADERGGAEPDETVVIGDSKVDVETARNGGAWCIGCTFGLAPESLSANPPDVLVDSPADWTAALSPARREANL